MKFKDGEKVTVSIPGQEPRDAEVVCSRKDLQTGEWYAVLFDDDESADPSLHEQFIARRGQTSLLQEY